MSETVRYLMSSDTKLDMCEPRDRDQLEQHMHGILGKPVEILNHQRRPDFRRHFNRGNEDDNADDDVTQSMNGSRKRFRVETPDQFLRKASSASSSESCSDLVVKPTVSPEPVARLSPPAMDFKKKIKDRFMSSQQSPCPEPLEQERLASPGLKGEDSQEGIVFTPLCPDKGSPGQDKKQAGFVLHPSGSYYLATHFDLTLAQSLAATQANFSPNAVHPVSISVAFNSN
jgi:hypothetical protein